MLPVDPSEVERQVSKWSSRSAHLLTDSRSAKDDAGLEITLWPMHIQDQTLDAQCREG